MDVVIGCDHAAFHLKEQIAEFLRSRGCQVRDLGTYAADQPCDYPDMAVEVGNAVASGKFARGILICGTGIGMSIAANKVKGIRAALCHDVYSARLTRQHNDSNVLCMGARVIGPGLAEAIVAAWLDEEFNGGRHQRRVDKINSIL